MVSSDYYSFFVVGDVHVILTRSFFDRRLLSLNSVCDYIVELRFEINFSKREICKA